MILLLMASAFAFQDASSTTVVLAENGKPVYAYNYGTIRSNTAPAGRERADYVFPLYAPNGVVVTDDFPPDHWHHRGVFWMWPLITVDGKTYDGWMEMQVRQRFVKWLKRQTSAHDAVLAAENGWYLGERRIAREEVEIVAHPVEGNRRHLDFTIRLAALEKPLTLQGEMANRKGYGGFNLRFAPRENTVIRTPGDAKAADSNMRPLPWAELAADYQGKHAVVRITQDPANPGYPAGWCLRNYGVLGVNYPGLDPLTLEPGKTLTLKYRVTVTGE